VVLWFVGPSVLIVWAVFTSPAADYRLVAAGSLVPLLELPSGSPRPLHSVVGAALVMVAVMLGARGRRLLQRQLLGLPIGMLLHLVLDGAWTDDHAFWWPFLGWSWSTSDLPELGRGGFSVVLELAGAAACWFAYRRFRLDEPERRELFLRTGRIGRDVAR
jgi:amino acid transporter